MLQGDIGLNVAQMIVELIRDNRKIVDRITQEQIEMFVGLLRQNKVYTPRFLWRPGRPGRPAPLPQDFFKIMQLLGEREETPILSKFWAQGPPMGSKLHWAPLSKILDPPLGSQ